jgi:hypothetical protein
MGSGAPFRLRHLFASGASEPAYRRETTMIIELTATQAQPLARRLRDSQRPTSITPERWRAILAGETLELDFDELVAIGDAMGWQALAGVIRRPAGD